MQTFNRWEFSLTLINQLHYFAKTSDIFPLQSINTAIVLVESLNDYSRKYKSFHEIDDRILKRIKAIVINFINVSTNVHSFVDLKFALSILDFWSKYESF